MSEEKTTHSKLSEARRRANKKYNDRFVEMKELYAQFVAEKKAQYMAEKEEQ